MNKTIDILGEEKLFDCMGCDIGSHKMTPPGGLIYEDDLYTVSQDPEIPIVGLMILGIKRHIKSINELSRDERINLMDVLNLTIENMKKIGLCSEVMLLEEERSSHFHMWILPILPWMDKFDKNARNIDDIINYSYEIYNDEVKEELLNTIDKLKEKFKE